MTFTWSEDTFRFLGLASLTLLVATDHSIDWSEATALVLLSIGRPVEVANLSKFIRSAWRAERK
jgi:hypothetical protein